MFQGGDFRQAAVLLAVVQHEAQWQILLTRRADSLRHHTGQIALAGGRRDAQDPNLTATALRETAEETGIATRALAGFSATARLFHPLGLRRSPVPALSASPLTRPNADEVAKSLPAARFRPLHCQLSKQRLHPQRPHALHAHAALSALRHPRALTP